MVARYEIDIADVSEARTAAAEHLHEQHKGCLRALKDLVALVSKSLRCPGSAIVLKKGVAQSCNVSLGFTSTPTVAALDLASLLASGEPVALPDVNCGNVQNLFLPKINGTKAQSLAACPIHDANRQMIGVLLAADVNHRDFDTHELVQLALSARLAEGAIQAHQGLLKTDELLTDLEAKRAQATKRYELLELVEREAGVGGWEADITTNDVVMTQTARDILELPADYEPRFDRKLNYFAPEIRDYIAGIYARGIATGEPWQYEVPIKTATGKSIWLKAKGCGVMKDGKVTHLVGSMQDVTESRSLLDRLEANERLAQEKSNELEVILANLHQGVSVYDADGCITLWNKHYLELFPGLRDKVHVGMPLSEILTLVEIEEGFPGGDASEYLDILHEKLPQGETVNAQVPTSDGRIVRTVVAPLEGGRWVATHEDVTEEAKAAARIAYAAHHDTLTEVTNRNFFNETLESVLAGRADTAVYGGHVLMLLDLDKFKHVNDTHGHATGDEVLKHVAHCFRTNVRETDLVSRIGGDEFAIILAGDTMCLQRSKRVAERLIESISKPFVIDGHTIEIGLSIGITDLFSSAHEASAILKRADEALYAVKRDGRNGFQIYNGRQMAS